MKKNKLNLMVCINCISNYGLRRTIEKLGHRQMGTCEHCKNKGWIFITENDVESIVEEFFVNGTISPQYRHRCFQVTYGVDGNDYQNLDYKITPDIEKDLKLLGKYFDIGVRTPFINMRNAWGDTLIRGEIVMGIKNLPASRTELEKALDNLIDGCKKEYLPAHSLIFRIRKNPKNPHQVSDFDSPPMSILKNDGRFNNEDFSLFYCSTDPETCLYESKFDPVDTIILATFEAINPIEIVDLTRYNNDPQNFMCGDLEVFISAICRSTKDYYLLRYISKRIYERGFAGFKYNSFFNRYREVEYNNIALFGYPVAEKKLRLTSLNNIDVNGLKLNWAPGPALAFHNPESIIDDGLY